MLVEMANQTHLTELRKGVGNWNQWRKNHPEITPNLNGVKLNGANLNGANLNGAELIGANLKSTNFTGANLVRANFTGAECGLQRRWAILWVVSLFVIAGIFGFICSFATGLLAYKFKPNKGLNNEEVVIVTVLLVIIVGTFIATTIRKGLKTGLVVLAVSVAAGVIIAGGISVLREEEVVAGTIVTILIISGVVVGTIIGVESIIVALIRGLTEVVKGKKTIVKRFRTIGGETGAVFVGLLGAGAGLVVIAGARKKIAGVAEEAEGAIINLIVRAYERLIEIAGIEVVLGALAIMLIVVILGIYIGWLALNEESENIWLQDFTLVLAATGGTSFQGANLTKANFTGATLTSTDFREAILTRVNWSKAKMLDRVRPGDTYLKDVQVRKWLVGEGTDKNFDRKDLRGINLPGANLKDASFIGADLNEANLQDADLSTAKLEKTQLNGTDLKQAKLIDASLIGADLNKANLQDADLSRAKLIQAQLDETDLTGATLTGACIEDWGINSQTKLDDVICDYVYLKEDKQERLPHDPDRSFKPGEFTKYVEKALNTVDLIFTDGIDWSAFLTSFEELQDEYGAENLGVQAIERKSGDTFVVRIEVPPEANKAYIESQIKQSYETKLQVLEAQYRSELKDLEAYHKDEIISLRKEHNTQILELAKLAASRPINVSQVQGNNMAGDRKVDISGNAQVNASGAGAFGLGDIYGTVANTINELPSSSNPDQAGIKELLTELKKAIDAPDLSEDDKEQTLGQLKVLAEAGKNPQDASMQKKAERAVKLLKVIAEGLEPATKLAQTCTRVLPKILLFFGL